VPVKKIVRIGQYLAKIWTKVCGLFRPPCSFFVYACALFLRTTWLLTTWPSAHAHQQHAADRRILAAWNRAHSFTVERSLVWWRIV